MAEADKLKEKTEKLGKRMDDTGDSLGSFAQQLVKAAQTLDRINFNVLRETNVTIAKALKLYGNAVKKETAAVEAADLTHRQLRLQGDRLKRSYGQFADGIFATVKIQNNLVAQAAAQYNLAQAATAQAVALLAQHGKLVQQNDELLAKNTEQRDAQIKKIASLNSELSSIKDSIKQHQDVRTVVDMIRGANEQKISAIKEELGYTQSQLNVAKEERSAVEQRIQKIKEANAAMDSEIQSTKDKLNANRSTVESLKSQIEIQTSIRAESGRNIDRLKYLNDSYTSEISEINKVLTETRTKYKRGQKMSAADESLIAELEAMKASAENRRAANEATIDTEINTRQSLSAAIGKMEAQITELTGQEGELNSKISELTDAIGQNKDELVKQNIQHLGLTETIGGLQSEAEGLSTQLQASQAEQRKLSEVYGYHTDSISGLHKDAVKLGSQLTDASKTQDELNHTQQELLKKQKDLGDKTGNLTKAVKDLSAEAETKRQELINAKFERFTKVSIRITEVLNGLVNPVLELQKQFGISAGSAARLKLENLASSAKSYAQALLTGQPGVSSKEIEDTQGAFKQEFGGVLTSAAATELAKEAKRLGVGASEMAKARRVFMTQTMGNVGEARAAQNKLMAEFAKKGLTASDAMEAIGKYSDLAARNGTRFQQSFFRAAADAKKIGVDLSKIDQVGDNIIDNFEGFLESQSELGAMGFNFDTSRLAELAEGGDTGALMNELRSQLASTGKDITKLRRSEQLALSKSFGLSMEELQRMAGPTAAAGETTMSPEDLQKDANKYLGKAVYLLEAIAIGIGLLNSKMLISGARSIAGRFMGRGASTVATEVAGTATTAGKAASVVGEAATAGRTVGTAAEAAAAVGTASKLSRFGSLAKFGGKALGMGGRLLGKAALPLSVAMSAYDAYKGFTADKDATTGQKFKNAGSSVLSGLTFGLLGKDASEIAAEKQTSPTASAAKVIAPLTVGIQQATTTSAATSTSTTPTPTTTVTVDLTRLEQKLDAVVRAIGSMEVKMDGNKVGKILVNTSDSARTVGVFRQDARATL